ncbi:MAG: hypothetical protein AB4058_19740 [Microcystaceae cyanobacterium]
MIPITSNYSQILVPNTVFSQAKERFPINLTPESIAEYRIEVETGKTHRYHLMQRLERRLRCATKEGNQTLIQQLQAEWRDLFPEYPLPTLS